MFLTTVASDKLIADLESQTDTLHVILLFFAFLVVLGVVLECGKELILYLHDVVAKIRKHPTQGHRFTLVLFGGVLVALGVAGELFIEYRSHSVETELRKANAQASNVERLKVAAAQKEAENAKKEASEAKGKYEELRKEAALAQTALLDRLRQNEPRGYRLNEGRLHADKKIRQFSGQRVLVLGCRDGRGMEEKEQTMSSLMGSLTFAKWDVRYQWIDCGGVGLSVHYSSSSNAETRTAAIALASAIAQSLGYGKGRQRYMPKLAQEVSPGSKFPPQPEDPNTVVVLINGR